MTEIVVGLLVALVAYKLTLGNYDISITTSVAGPVSASSARTVSSGTRTEAAPTVLAAQPGQLTTRTNNTSGTLTMTNSGHGLTTGQKVDLYWTGGQAYRATLGTVSGTTVPIASVAGGDVLPAALSTINVGVIVERAFDFDGDDCRTLIVSTNVAGYVKFVSVSGTAETVEWVEYISPGAAYIWDVDSGLDNPLAGLTLAEAHFSQSATDAATTSMYAGAYRN